MASPNNTHTFNQPTNQPNKNQFKQTMGLSYKAACSLCSTIILMCTCFIMGVFYSNLSYDSHLLFNPTGPTEADYALVLTHYQTLRATATPLLYILAAIAAVGIIAHLVRTYKPNPELQYFEYGSLIVYILGICVFITNIKTGIDCTITHQWGEVDEQSGLAVLGSSNIILLCVFSGVIFLQAGLWWSTMDYEARLAQFVEEERLQQLKAATAQPTKTKNGKKGKKSE